MHLVLIAAGKKRATSLSLFYRDNRGY